MPMLLGEIVFEVVKFVVMICLVAIAWILGGKLRKSVDAKKATEASVETTKPEE